MRTLAFLLLFTAGCAGDDAKNQKGDDQSSDGCSDTEDADGDGLDDCAEVDTWGTDPDVADSDGDGLADGEEADCGSDPLDTDEKCYACGWRHDDPGTLTASGAGEGDTIENLPLVDQCDERVSLWDFAEEYHILFITAAW